MLSAKLFQGCNETSGRNEILGRLGVRVSPPLHDILMFNLARTFPLIAHPRNDLISNANFANFSFKKVAVTTPTM